MHASFENLLYAKLVGKFAHTHTPQEFVIQHIRNAVCNYGLPSMTKKISVHTRVTNFLNVVEIILLVDCCMLKNNSKEKFFVVS